ncbi:Caudovirales tail fiber assembly protein [compost metagenome]
MSYFYSASNNAFYAGDLQESYEASNNWPDDLKPVDEDIFSEFTKNNPGKIRVASKDGLPAWEDIPPPTHEEKIAEAEQYRQQLLQQNDEVTADWRVELMLGDISDGDKEKLSEWMAYKKAVKAVDISMAPDITWPKPPEE